MSQAEAYDHRYSDRDVRENPDLRAIALDYLETYGGSFEPLLRLKLYSAQLEEGEVLQTQQIRMILNCMRHDPAVASGLPAPKFPYMLPRQRPPATPEMGKVIQMPKRRGKVDCGNKEPHEYHGLGTGTWCEGVPFEINRYGHAYTQATIKMNYVASRTGALVHKLTGVASLQWTPNRHDWGFLDHPTSVSVKLVCKLPSWVRDGLLFKEEPVHLYTDDAFGKERCPRCFAVTELREGAAIPKQRAQEPTFLPPVCMIPDCGCSGYAHP